MSCTLTGYFERFTTMCTLVWSNVRVNSVVTVQTCFWEKSLGADRTLILLVSGVDRIHMYLLLCLCSISLATNCTWMWFFATVFCLVVSQLTWTVEAFPTLWADIWCVSRMNIFMCFTAQRCLILFPTPRTLVRLLVRVNSAVKFQFL